MPKQLKDKKVLITREKQQAKVFAEKVLRYGGIPVEVPLLKITCKDRAEDRWAFQSLSKYKWIFFTSANGVHYFFQLAKKYHVHQNLFKNIKLAAVGHKTEKALETHGLTADFIPTIYNAAHMADEFFMRFPDEDPFLLVRGNRSRNVLPEAFSKIGATFDMIEVYETVYNEEATEDLNKALVEHQFDFITFTSPSTVDAFMKLQKDRLAIEKSGRTIFVCIGSTTEQRAKEVGFHHTLSPREFTIEGMLDCMQNYAVTEG